MTEDEMVGWHHRLNGHEFEQAPGVGDGQGSLACCSPWDRKEPDTTERLNNNNYMIKLLEDNIGKTFSDINRTEVFLGQSPRQKKKSKNKQMGHNQTYKLCTAKEECE